MMQVPSFPVLPPEEMGISSANIERMLLRLQRAQLDLHSILLLRGGALLAEGYWRPFSAELPHRVYSVTKSFTSLAIGLLVGEGKLLLSDRPAAFFPEKCPPGGMHPWLEQTTVRDLLRMASPHERTAYHQIPGDDWIASFFAVPPTHRPGTVFCYDTSASHLLGALVERLTGEPLLDYLRPRLLEPIGWEGPCRMLYDPAGVSRGGDGLVATSRDLARFGQLLLQGGCWKGRQLLPPDYLREATSRQIDTGVCGLFPDDRLGYGYQFWQASHGAFACCGWGGQSVICLPREQLLLVTTGAAFSSAEAMQTIYTALFEEIVEPLKNDLLPADPAAATSLRARLDSLTLAVPTGVSVCGCTGARTGVRYRLEPNALGWLQAAFSFGPEEGALRFETKDGWQSLNFGLGRLVQTPLPGFSGEAAAAAAWEREDSLLLLVHRMGDFPAEIRLQAVFSEDSLTLLVRSWGERGPLDGYQGAASGTGC